jgi:antitoxin component YwqK of YwqJK toxin-antitoxin module
MRYFALFGFILAAAGCGKMGDAVPAVINAAHHHEPAAATSAAGETEEFEGIVQLFGNEVRARRQVKLDADGNYVKHGRAVAWYENGQKAGEMWYVDDQPDGSERSWHENGKKKMVGQSQQGLADGKWIEWHDNGQKLSEGEYVDGEREGMWMFWAANGELQETIEYRLGKKISVAKNTAAGTTR